MASSLRRWPRNASQLMFAGGGPFLNVVLRTATLGTRFLLVFILAKYLSASSFGYYGLFAATVGYALLCIGLDLYVYTTREIVKVGGAKQGRMLKSQIAFVMLLYLFLLPLALVILAVAGFPYFLVLWFAPILILEHINQEIYRLMIILKHQITASLLLFGRQGSWALAVAGLMVIQEGYRNLTVVMSLWCAAGMVAAAAGIWKFRSLQLGGWRESIDWAWIKRGVSVSGTFLVATLAIRGVQTFDRFWLESLAGIEIVGAYVLFFGVASALSVFLDASIFSFRYPELIALAHRKAYAEMHSRVRRMGRQVAGASLAFALISSLLLPMLLDWIGRDIYQSQIALYYWILGGMVAYSLSMIPHYALYALRHDRAIVASHVAGLLTFFAATMALSQISQTHAVPIGVFASMLAVLVWKMKAYVNISHRRVAL